MVDQATANALQQDTAARAADAECNDTGTSNVAVACRHGAFRNVIEFDASVTLLDVAEIPCLRRRQMLSWDQNCSDVAMCQLAYLLDRHADVSHDGVIPIPARTLRGTDRKQQRV